MPRPARRQPAPSPAALLRHGFLVAVALFTVLPFVWMLSAAAKTSGEILQGGLSLLPGHPGTLIENLARVFAEVPLGLYMANGVFVCTAILALQLLIAIPCAYALAKLRFKGRGPLFGLVLLGLLVPVQVTALPIYVLCYVSGLTNSYWALVLPFVASAFGIFLFRQFFVTLPDSVLEAARLDGLGETEIVWRIAAPAARPAIAAFSIFSVIFHWNDLFWPLIVITDQTVATPPLGIVFFRNQEAGEDFAALMAASVVVTAPMVLVFLLTQRRFVEGIALSPFRK